MSDPRKYKRPLKECPFCGSTDLSLTGPESVDEGREYEVSLSCGGCDCKLPLRVSYKKYDERTYVMNMVEPLFRLWNQRSGEKITMEVKFPPLEKDSD